MGSIRPIIACIIAVALAGNAMAMGPISVTTRTLPAGLKSPLFGYDITPPLGKQYQRYTVCVYNAAGGQPSGFTFSYEIIGPKEPISASDNNGGHAHADQGASPPTSRPVGEFRYKGSTTRAINASGVSTECAQPVDHLTPLYAGKTSAELLITLPAGWHTVYPGPLDTSYSSWKYLYTFDVGYPGLTALPTSSDGKYVKSRNPRPPDSDTKHIDADAFSINADARDYLEALIWYYNYASGNALSINDISLLKGGHFDIEGKWTGSHAEHRFGTEVDINQSATLPCHENYWIRGIVRGLMPTRTMALSQPTKPGWTRFGRLLCEKDNIHLNLEVMLIDP